MTSSRQTAALLAGDAQRIFGDRLRTVALYGRHAKGEATGPVSCVCLVASLTHEDLDACAAEVRRWHGLGLATPLVVPVGEFEQSLDAFPLEYGDIIAHHEVVAGPDLLQNASVDPADLRRACETQVKSHLLHLRQEYLEASQHPATVAALIARAAPAFATLLAQVARLEGANGGDLGTAAHAGARLAGLSDSTVNAVLAQAEGTAMSAPDGARLFPEYLTAVGQLATFVDGWGD